MEGLCLCICYNVCLFTIGLELNVVMVLIKSPFTFIFALRLTISWITQWGAGRDYLVTPNGTIIHGITVWHHDMHIKYCNTKSLLNYMYYS